MNNVESSSSVGQLERFLLSICMVTCDQERASNYIAHHSIAFAHADIENLIFCPPSMVSSLERTATAASWRYRILSDDISSGPGRKRNALLRSAQGRFCMFLDDDSLLESPVESLATLLQQLTEPGREWVLTTAVYVDNLLRRREEPPKPFSLRGPGSGIEWNQAFSRSLLLAEGGWHEEFCVGEKWRAGEALILMVRLWRKGLVPALVASVKVQHPAQVDESDLASLAKVRRYRYAVGAVIAQEAPTFGAFGVAVWVARCMLLAPIAGLLDLARGRKLNGLVRLASPLDFARGFYARLLAGA